MITRNFTIGKILFFVILCFISVNLSGQKRNTKRQPVIAKVDSSEIVLSQSQGAPVSPFIDTLFLIHGGIGSFTVEQRATAIEDKIKQLSVYPLFEGDSLKLVEFDNQINVVYDDPKYQSSAIIVSIDTLQAKIYGKSKSELAHSYRSVIVNAIDKERYESSWKRITIQVLSIIGIIIAEYFFIRLILYLYRRSRIAIRAIKNKRLKGLFGIIDPDKEVQIIFAIFKILRFLLIAISISTCILLIFKLFPHTTSLADQFLDYIVSLLKKIGYKVKNYMPDLFTMLIILIIFIYVKKFLRSITDKVSEGKITFRGFYPDWAKPTYNIVIVILAVFTFILIFPYLPESDSNIFQGVSVFVGLIISLGSTNVIANLIAGLVITYMRPFKVGDRIKMDDCVGNIIEKTPLATRVKTAKNEIITIPNSTVMSAKTINYTSSANQYGLILYTTVTVGYDIPWRQVHELLLKVAFKTEHLNRKQKPFIMQTALNDFYVEYQLNVYTKDANRMNDIYSDLRKNVQDVFKEAGINLVAPHYRINKNVKNFDENQTHNDNED